MLVNKFTALALVLLAAAACSSSAITKTPPSFDGGARPPDGSTSVTVDATIPVDSDAKAAFPDVVALDGPGTLTTLSVKAAAGSPSVTLAPAFSPKIYDYSIACQAGNNPLIVSMSAAGGGVTQLVAPTTSPKAASQTLDVSVPEGGAIVATVTVDGVATEYWVRCLPQDFPPPVWNPHAGADKVTPGYYLLGGWWPPSGHAGYAMVIDPNGVPVWFSKGPQLGVSDVVALRTNQVTYFPFQIGAIYPYETFNLTAETMTTVAPSSNPSSQHEIILLSNGDYLVLTTPYTPNVDLSGLMLSDNGTTTPLGPGMAIQDCAVVEFKPDGTPVHTWLMSDHFDPKTATVFAGAGTCAETGYSGCTQVIDVFHCNSIDIDPNNGNLLVSARHLDSVFYIDWTGTQKVLWKMGGNNASLDGAKYIPVDSPFSGQHDGRLISGWSDDCGGKGQISVFDDGTFSNTPARAALFDVVIGDGDAGACGGDAAVGRASLAWQYKTTQATGLGGSFRIEQDGNRLIGWGSFGASNQGFTEVDPSGTDLLDFYFADEDSSYRSIKVPLTTFDLQTLRRTAGIQ